MAAPQVKFIFSLGILLLLLIEMCNSTPVNQESNKKSITVEKHLKQWPADQGSGRTILKEGMDFMKDMFDFGSVTWIPLGSLIFGNKDDSISFAKWPSKNKN